MTGRFGGREVGSQKERAVLGQPSDAVDAEDLRDRRGSINQSLTWLSIRGLEAVELGF